MWHGTFSRIGKHYNDVMMGAMASQITSLTIAYSTVYSCADQRKHQSSASLAFARGIHRWPVNSTHKWPVTRKMFPFYYVIMNGSYVTWVSRYDITACPFYTHDLSYFRSFLGSVPLWSPAYASYQGPYVKVANCFQLMLAGFAHILNGCGTGLDNLHSWSSKIQNQIYKIYS